jgi:putative Mg2+ transporter-C (MgtC) family protein
VLGGVGLIAGEGFALFGLLAAVLVIGANTALRPIVRVINRQPVDFIEEEQHYLISIVCRPARAADIRSELVKEVAGVPDLQFSELDSAFLEDAGRVEVTATVTSHKRRELALEAIVGKFSEMDGVIRAAWRLNLQAS